MRRRKKRSQLDRIVLGAAKQIRKQRLEFEREASKALSDALGFLVVVKIQKALTPTQAGLSPAMRKAQRQPAAKVKEMILDQLRPIEEKADPEMAMTGPAVVSEARKGRPRSGRRIAGIEQILGKVLS